MSRRNPDPLGAELPEVLSEPVAARLLARASELDAADAQGVSVAELRAAAVEAGISERAYEAALSEVHGRGPVRRVRAWVLTATMAVLLVGGAFAVVPVRTRPASGPQAGPRMVDEAILVRCLSPGEAAALVRPHLQMAANTILVNPTRAPRILTIHATPAQLREVRALLDQYERGGSATCGAGPAPARAR